MKQKILFFTRIKPALDGPGVQLRCARHIVSLAKIFDVILIHSTHKDEDIKEMEDYCHSIKKVKKLKSKYSAKGIFSSSFDENYGAPSTEEVEQVRSAITLYKPVKIFLFRLATAKLLDSKVLTELLPAKNWLLDFDDIESRATIRYAMAHKKELGKYTTFKVMLDALKLRKLEHSVCKQIGRIFICSKEDKHLLEKRMNKKIFHVVPNVISHVDPLELGLNQGSVLFVGTMNYMPNEQAAVYFCEEILPLINAQMKIDIKVKIVGFNPSKEVLALAYGNVEVTGGVDSVRPYYEEAKVVIAPILSGGGTRIKILEAMSYNRAVVSSTIGAEGLGVQNGTNILLADNAKGFSDAVVKLITSKELNTEIANNGLSMVIENFTQQTLDGIYSDMFLMDRANS